MQAIERGTGRGWLRLFLIGCCKRFKGGRSFDVRRREFPPGLGYFWDGMKLGGPVWSSRRLRVLQTICNHCLQHETMYVL